jgi:hypothetical protein
VHHYAIKIFKELLKMKNMYAKAWICVGVMMLGIVILMSSLAFLGNKVMMNICLVLGAIAFLAGIILNFIIVRCPHCGSHIGRVYGSRCPHCGEEYSRK